jgi:hypothetical protein
LPPLDLDWVGLALIQPAAEKRPFCRHQPLGRVPPPCDGPPRRLSMSKNPAEGRGRPPSLQLRRTVRRPPGPAPQASNI